jgi:hypothetical protein
MALTALYVSGCATAGKKMDAETEPEQTNTEEWLKSRLELYAHAMSINDFNATYSMESEKTRKSMSFDDYLQMKYSSNAEQEVYRVSRIQYDRRKKEYFVKIKVTLVNLPRGVKLALADTKGEWWKYENGDWFRKGPAKKPGYKQKKENPVPKDDKKK